MSEPTWDQTAAHKLIVEEAYKCFLQANATKKGSLRKIHVPYPLPEWVHKLTHYMGVPDGEHECKRIMEAVRQGALSQV